MRPELQSAMRLGNMLVELGVLSEADLTESAQVAIELALPLAKVLVMSGFLSDNQLQAAIQAQSMIKDQLLAADIAGVALRLVHDKNLSWEDALKESGWVEPDVLPLNKLGSILVEAQIIKADELNSALEQAKQSGLPLGRVLSLTNKISDAFLYSCLNAQVLLRDGKITREQAIAGLRSAQDRHQPLEQALVTQGSYKPVPKAKVKLGEMLVLAGMLNEETIMDSIETGLTNNEAVGQVLLRSGELTMNQLDAVLKLQQMVDNGAIAPLHAAEALREVATRGIPISQAIADLGLNRTTVSGITLGGLLKQAGVISEEDINEALRQSVQNAALLAKILNITGFVDEETIHAATRCQTLVKVGSLQEDQAIIALNYCRKMQCSLDDALVELGWTHKPQPAKSPAK